jgi:hypothetical protein
MVLPGWSTVGSVVVPLLGEVELQPTNRAAVVKITIGTRALFLIFLFLQFAE